MPLITYPVQNLIGGVNQQPAAIRAPNEAEALDNALPSPIEGLGKRPPTESVAIVADGSGNFRSVNTDKTVFVHLIERDEAEKYMLVVQENGTPDVYDLSPGANYGTRKTLYIDGSTSLGTAAASKRKAVTIGDVTFIANATTLVASGAGTVASNPTNYNQAALVWIRQGNYNRSHIVSLKYTPTGGSLTTSTFKHKTGGSGEVGTEHVALGLFDGSVGATYTGPSGGIVGVPSFNTSTHLDSVIYIKGAVDFEITTQDSFGGEGISVIRNKVERFEDLPPTAPHNYMVEIVGVPESDFDNYWVQFKADNGTFSRGVWEECPAPGIKYQWDTASMPILLIRQSNGTFMLKKADGITPSVANGRPSGDSATVYDKYKWTERLVGNDTTNPYPSFVGLGIQDMVYHQSRLGFMAGENIVFSETADFFNFFRTTVLDVLDSDPIDIASSSPRVGKIMAAVPFNRDLILFTPNGQMLLRGGEILSPRSIAIIAASEFDSQASTIKPIASANAVFFTYDNGGYTGMRELVPQPALDGSYLANDLTATVSRYIPGNPTHLAATTHDNLAVVVSNGNLYCYRYYDSGGRRLQSAWFRFTFQDSNPNSHAFARVLWANFIESELYVLMHRTKDSTSGYLCIEKIRIGPGTNDMAVSGKDWMTHLDQRSYLASGQGTYDPNTDRTTFTLPKPMSYAAGKTMAVTTNGIVLPIVEGTNFNTSTQASGIVKVVGNWSNTAVWIGTVYEMLYEFSTPYIKNQTGEGQAPFLRGRCQLRHLTLQFADSGYFRVVVAIKNGDTYEYPFTGEVLGTTVLGTTNIQDGSFTVPLHSKNDNVTIRILNDSPVPSKILNAEFEISYESRAIRYAG